MKRKMIFAAALAAVLLSGCADKGTSSGGGAAELPVSAASSASVHQSVTQSAPAQSSVYSGAPAVVAPSFTSSSKSEPTVYSEPDVPVVVSSSEPEPAESSSEGPVVISPELIDGTVRTDGIDIPYGSSLQIGGMDSDFKEDIVVLSSGCELNVDGDLTVNAGCKLMLEDSSELNVGGKIRLDGEIVMTDGSQLKLLYDDSDISGFGSIRLLGDFDSIDCEMGRINVKITPPERKVIDGITTVGGIVIANKAITLTPDYGDHLYLDQVEYWVSDALDEMNYKAKEVIGHTYVNKSGYRSYYDQKAIFANYCSLYGEEEANTFSSQAGHSEHQTGLTMDLDAFEESYGSTPEGQWLAENCWKYGFIIRYPKGKEHITGYTYEPWHVRWLGKSTAKLVHLSGLTLEEFLNVEGGWDVID